jgi:hypothetical protein
LNGTAGVSLVFDTPKERYHDRNEEKGEVTGSSLQQ